MQSSPPEVEQSCWMSASAARTSSGSGSVSSSPIVEFSSSTSPSAATRRLSLAVRLPSPRPVVPSSPVRVAIAESGWPWGLSPDGKGVEEEGRGRRSTGGRDYAAPRAVPSAPPPTMRDTHAATSSRQSGQASPKTRSSRPQSSSELRGRAAGVG
jgi:hypothetical protein